MKTSIHSSPRSAPLPLLLLLLAALLLLTAAVHAVDEPKVGGLTKIKHVGSNKEVQELGRFSVGEYNDRLRGRDANPLAFVKVVEAQQQVVEGMQYYLKIAVAAPDGSHKIYNAVVWDRPWLKSRQVMSFTPSTK
ncbi:Cysteine proteinase inhibitor 10 [Ananas comosus]|uniref:Cysteine proteinase inhibitor 10 n=1 Tax=Ananas comosus TaxID=4615 RepID=A0A199UK04_ANACO|nr:Cysteine proteinase inhibitor 10 [Ananas comosus]